MALCSQSSTFLKIATLCVIIASVLCITGFATTRWSTVDTEIRLTSINFKGALTFLVGLWKICSCVDVPGIETCTYEEIESPPGWLKAVRGLIIIAVIGMIIGSLLAVIDIFKKFSKQLKISNIIVIVGSGVLLIIAIIVYGIEIKKQIDKVLGPLYNNANLDVHTLHKFGFSFVLTTLAGCICLVVCVPLLILDLNTPPKQSDIAITPMRYNNQGHVISYPQGPSFSNPGNMQQPHRVTILPPIYPAPPNNNMCTQQFVPPPYALAQQGPVGVSSTG